MPRNSSVQDRITSAFRMATACVLKSSIYSKMTMPAVSSARVGARPFASVTPACTEPNSWSGSMRKCRDEDFRVRFQYYFFLLERGGDILSRYLSQSCSTRPQHQLC